MTGLVKIAKSPEEMREAAARICRDYLNGAWKTVGSDEIQLKRISGGLSNFLYYVSLPDGNENNNSSPTPRQQITKTKRIRTDSSCNTVEPREVLLRIYGQTHGENALETMLTESVVFTLLSERNLGPKLHGIFPGGRIEQYIPARALSTSELSDNKISLKIAEKMAQIHCMNIPVSKEPDWLWNTLYRWLKTANNVLKESNQQLDVSPREELIEICKTDFNGEVKWLKTVIDQSDFPVVFSHNDLQEGNILFKEEISRPNSIETLSNGFEDSSTLDRSLNDILDNSTAASDKNVCNDIVNGNPRKRSIRSIETSLNDLDCTRDSVLSCNSMEQTEPDLIIIDFEYCAYNYRGFDLANHFLEWTYDYTNEQYPYYYQKTEQYPTKKQQMEFVSNYLSKLTDCDDYQPTMDEIEEVIDEVKFFTLVSHLFWTLWSIVNVHQDIEFGYWDYARSRLREYIKAKENYIKSQGKNGNKLSEED